MPKFDFEIEPKQHFISHASRLLLCILFVAVAFQYEEVFEGGTPPLMTYFCLALDLPLGGYGRNILMHMRSDEHFVPTKFYQNPSSGSGEVENVKVYAGRTDGRRTVRYDISSLEPSVQMS